MWENFIQINNSSIFHEKIYKKERSFQRLYFAKMFLGFRPENTKLLSHLVSMQLL